MTLDTCTGDQKSADPLAVALHTQVWKLSQEKLATSDKQKAQPNEREVGSPTRRQSERAAGIEHGRKKHRDRERDIKKMETHMLKGSKS